MARRRRSSAGGRSPLAISKADQALLKLAKERFAQAEEADSDQRERELADLRFYAGDQWDAAVKRAREGQAAIGGMPPVPARPTYVINKVREPVNQVLNEERASDMGIELVAADDFEGLSAPIDDTEVQLREGLTRRIQRDSQAADARTWAFARATISGRGYYGIMTRFLPGKTFDQECYVHRFYNQGSVSLDPSHEQPDGSDAEWGFVGNDLPWAQYTAEYPRAGDGTPNAVATASVDEFRALGDEAPGWFTSEGETRSCRVVDYWYTTRKTRTLCQLSDGSAWWQDELPDDAPPAESTREVIEKTIQWCKIDGAQVLDRTDWPGPDLPIIKVLGVELQPYDGERRAEGMVRPSRDAQAGFNSMVSKWVETVALAPIPPFQAAPAQVEPFKPWYEQANTRTLPYLPYEPVMVGGTLLPPPARTQVDVPIQAIAGSVQMFDEAIKSTTGIGDPQLGHVDRSLKSGRAIQALQAQSQHGTSNFLDNLKRSIRYEGQIINNLLYPIYGKPGRMVRILNGQGESETVQIQTPPVEGQPTPLPGQPPAPGVKPPKQLQLTKEANFNVIIKVTRSFDSRREQEASIIADLLTANPALLTWFGDLFFKHQDGPGHTEMAERAKVMLDPKIQAMLDQQKSGEDPIPPQVQAAMAQQQEQLQRAEQIMQAQGEELKQKKAEQDAKIEIERLGAEKEIRLQTMKDATAIDVAKINALAKGVVVDKQAEDEMIALNLKLQSAEKIALQTAQMSQQTAREAAARGKPKTVVTSKLLRGPAGELIGKEESRQEVPVEGDASGDPALEAVAVPTNGSGAAE